MPSLKGLSTVYSFNLECLKFRFTALMEGICTTLNLHIQALFIDTKDIYLKDIFLALTGSAKKVKNQMPVKNISYTVFDYSCC